MFWVVYGLTIESVLAPMRNSSDIIDVDMEYTVSDGCEDDHIDDQPISCSTFYVLADWIHCVLTHVALQPNSDVSCQSPQALRRESIQVSPMRMQMMTRMMM